MIFYFGAFNKYINKNVDILMVITISCVCDFYIYNIIEGKNQFWKGKIVRKIRKMGIFEAKNQEKV